jgi:hypothetical protein
MFTRKKSNTKGLAIYRSTMSRVNHVPPPLKFVSGVKLPVHYGGVADLSKVGGLACLGLQGFAKRPLKTPPRRG